MNTQEFMAMILPDGENFFVAEVPAKGKGPVKHYHATSHGEMARKAIWRDADTDDCNVYYAMASFKEPSYMVGTKVKKRTQDNVHKLKCFWVDLDCKGKNDGTDYADQKEAITDLRRFSDETGLPMPTIINSGYGVHAYWVLTNSITKDEWVEAAGKFRSTLDSHGVRHDSSCTTDCARILRPVGTFNKKPQTPNREVKLIGPVRNPLDLSEFLSKLVASRSAFSMAPTGAFRGADMSMNEIGESVVEFRPSSIKEIVKECALIRAIGKAGGNVAEPLWHKTLGLVKHTIEGAQAIHLFSRGHPDYTPEATVEKAESWGAGPTTCKVLHENSAPALKEHCDKCPHKGAISSPITLGYQKVMMTETFVTVVADQLVTTTVEVPALPYSMQHSYKWDDDKLWRRVLDKDATKESGTNEFMWVAFCEFYFYPFSYYDDEDDKHRVVWRLREREGVFREFTLSGGAMGAGGQALFKELGDHSVTATTNNKAHMEAYITNFVTDVKKRAPSTKTYTNYGWNDDDFIIGNCLISNTGEHKQIRLGGGAEDLFKKGYFDPTGTPERWAELVDKLYNYKGQEQFQFILCTGFGSPLLRLMDCDGGTVISAVSRGSGHGKSTAGKLATGIYGDGRSGRLTLTLEQASPKAVHAMAGILNGIPIMLDEVTNIDPMAASTVVYTHSQGSGRIVLQTNGMLNLGRHSWSSVMNISANTSISSLIQSVKPGAEAEQARMIEFEIEDVSTINKSEADAILRELSDIKCVVGMKFMTWVQSHREEVKSRLTKVQVALDTRLGLSKKDRYWSYAIAGGITGAMIAKELGLINFNITNILRWLEGRVLDIRKEAESIVSTPSQLFSSMLTSLSPGFIVTDIEGDRRQKLVPTMIREPRAPYSGRVVVNNGRLYVPQPMVHKWCAENQVNMKGMVRDMVGLGWIMNSGEAAPRCLAKGTHITMGQFRCYEIDTSKMEASTEVAPDFANVVSIFKGEVAACH